jgi:hypothetical protein
MPLNNLAATLVLAADRRSVDMVMVDGSILKCHDRGGHCRAPQHRRNDARAAVGSCPKFEVLQTAE